MSIRKTDECLALNSPKQRLISLSGSCRSASAASWSSCRLSPRKNSTNCMPSCKKWSEVCLRSALRNFFVLVVSRLIIVKVRTMRAHRQRHSEEVFHERRMRGVTISREYGSGGGEIATRLAKRLGWQLIDHALVERVASEIGTSTQEAEAHDEHVQGMVLQALNSLLYLYPAAMASTPPDAFLSDEEYRDAFNRVVRAAATRGHVVIVGRASQVTLAELRDVLHVRIIAPFEKRAAYVMQREGIDRH